MRQSAIAGIVVLGLLAQGRNTANASDKLDAAWEALTGSWRVESAKADNKEFPMKGVVYALGKDKSSMTTGAETADMKCALDVSGAPVKINLTPIGPKKEGVEAMRGIYKIEGDTLTICWAVGTVEEKVQQPGDTSPAEAPKHIPGKRPKKFTTDGAMLMTLARVGPAGEDPSVRKSGDQEAKESRAWHDTSGRKVEAALVEVKDGSVTLRRTDNGKTVTLPLARLSEPDQQYLKSAGGTANKSPQESAGEGAPTAQPANVIQVSAQDYYKEFKENTKAAIAKYENATVEVTGTCVGVYLMLDDEKTPRFGVFMSGDGTKSMGIDVFLCCLAGQSPWNQLAVGNEVTIRGVLPKPGVFKRTRRNLLDAKVVSQNAGQTVEITAVKLASEYDANPEETAKKYKDKWLVVEGPVLGPIDDPENENSQFCVLVGTKQHNILVSTGGSSRDAGNWKLGEKVTVIGTCSFLGRTIYPIQVSLAHRVEGFMAPPGKAPKMPLPTKKGKPKSS